MDEKYINDLYSELGGEEKFGKYEDFVELISNDDSYIQDFHSSFGESTLGSLEDFKGLVKKKDDTESAPPTEDATTTLVSEEVEETTPSGSSALQPEEEVQFQEFMQTNPDVQAWRKQYVEEYGEEPQIDASEYDYRGAWKAGLTPKPNSKHKVKSGEDAYHWGSLGIGGVDLKSEDHPTRWKSDYMTITGKNPDETGISNKRIKRC